LRQGRPDSVLRRAREIAAVRGARGQRRRRVQVDDQRACAGHAPERSQERKVADVSRHDRVLAVGRAIADRHRLDVARRVDDRLQQRALERQQSGAVGRRALGKYRDDVAAGERVRRVGVDAARVAAPVALDEQRAHALDEPPRDRPARQLRLRDEPHGLHGVQHEDVEPGHMVGHDEHVVPDGFEVAVHARVDVQHPQQAAAPAAGQPPPCRRLQQRKYERGGRDAFEQVRARARDAVEP